MVGRLVIFCVITFRCGGQRMGNEIEIRKELKVGPQRLNVTVSSSAARCVYAELTFLEVSS